MLDSLNSFKFCKNVRFLMQCFMLTEIQHFMLFLCIEYKIYTFGIVMKYSKSKKVLNMQICSQIQKSNSLISLLSLDAFFVRIRFSSA